MGWSASYFGLKCDSIAIGFGPEPSEPFAVNVVRVRNKQISSKRPDRFLWAAAVGKRSFLSS
jgi:hypothetical protein